MYFSFSLFCSSWMRNSRRLNRLYALRSFFLFVYICGSYVFFCIEVDIHNWRKQPIVNYKNKKVIKDTHTDTIIYSIIWVRLKILIDLCYLLEVGTYIPFCFSRWLKVSRRHKMKWNTIIRRTWRHWSWTTWARCMTLHRDGLTRSGLLFAIGCCEGGFRIPSRFILNNKYSWFLFLNLLQKQSWLSLLQKERECLQASLSEQLKNVHFDQQIKQMNLEYS